jgi:hypothetical protein
MKLTGVQSFFNKGGCWVAEYTAAYTPTTPRKTARARILISCVGNDDDLRTVASADGAFFDHVKGVLCLWIHNGVGKGTRRLAKPRMWVYHLVDAQYRASRQALKKRCRVA